jgi:hypothetical protein
MIRPALADFCNELRRCVGLLLETYSVPDLLEGRRCGRVPRTGEVGGISFYFHGRGLKFELPDDRVVDVDFCPAGVEVYWIRFRQFLPYEQGDMEDLRAAYLDALPAANELRQTVAGMRIFWWA